MPVLLGRDVHAKDQGAVGIVIFTLPERPLLMLWTGAFGEEYEPYRRRTWRLMPGLY
jgi:protein-S-isoprenylcysteine O-methyltransferase Ste14